MCEPVPKRDILLPFILTFMAALTAPTPGQPGPTMDLNELVSKVQLERLTQGWGLRAGLARLGSRLRVTALRPSIPSTHGSSVVGSELWSWDQTLRCETRIFGSVSSSDKWEEGLDPLAVGLRATRRVQLSTLAGAARAGAGEQDRDRQGRAVAGLLRRWLDASTWESLSGRDSPGPQEPSSFEGQKHSFRAACWA